MPRNNRPLGEYIDASARHLGIADATLRGSDIPVWAIIGYLQATNWNTQRTAEDYGINLDAVRAAIAYYELHREIIDARIAANVIHAG